MAFRVSPGVNFSEIDATQRVAPVATSDAAIAAGFQWGPADIVTTVSGESDLAEVFGEPDGDTAVNWLTAASFLAYSNSLQVIRTISTDAKNAGSDFSGTEGVVTDVEITAGGTGYTESSSNGTTVTTPASGGGTSLSVVTTVVDGIITNFEVAAGGSGWEPGQVFSITGGDSNATGTVEAVTSGGSVASILIENEDIFDIALPATTGAFFARYPGSMGNSLRVSIFHDDDPDNFANWKEDFIVNGVSKTSDYANLFDRAPGTSNHVLTRNGNTAINDEVHIVVVDADGKFSKTPGTVLESFAHVSLCTDAKDEQGNSNYIKDVIRNSSKYIYATGQFDEIQNTASPPAATNWETTSVNVSTGTTAFDPIGEPYSVDLVGGVADNTTSNGNSATARYTADSKGYGILRDTEQYDVSILIAGEMSNAQQIDLIDNVAEYRKDAVAVISPSTDSAKGTITSNTTQALKATAVADTWLGTGINKSSSYAIADSGYKRMYDRYSDTYRSIPLNGDIAGLIAQTEATRDAWFSPAGFQRGNIKNAVKLYFNPDQNSRDTVYKAGANPVVSFPGQGTVLYGDKTLYQKPSAFDRINVRRLFIVLEKAISRAAKQMLFEFNDEFTRSAFRGMVNPFLRDIQGRRGIMDFLVVCDTTNNTTDVIDRNEFVGDIYIKPSRSINFIQLNFVAVRSGVAFNEVAGIV